MTGVTVGFRSVAFNTLFYLNMIATLVAVTPVYFFLPQRAAIAVVRTWARFNIWLLKVVCGVRHEFRGLDRLPQGNFILAAKHQSFWETFALLPLLGNPAYVIKRQLLYVPVWGWWAWKARMIFVDRDRGTAALRSLAAGAREAMAENRPILIFPEGTRRAPGAEPAYKSGIVHLYTQTQLPVVPAGLNSGLYWPRRRFLRYPGTIVVEFMPAIEPGLRPRVFLDRLIQETEASCDRLLQEAAGPNGPPLASEARARIQSLEGSKPRQQADNPAART